METKPKLLWVGELPAPVNVRSALNDRWEVIPYCPDQPLGPQLGAFSLAIVYPDGQANDPARLGQVLDQLERTPAVAVFMLPDDARIGWELLSRRQGQFLCVRQTASPAELEAKFSAAATLQPTIQNLQAELAAARTIISTGTRTFDDLDEEMRLAARLQRDFLPRRLPEVGRIRFGVLYRPASWVSGDIYDVTRLDETHVGFYVVDAVGHGMPAALLTMFVKKALQTKRIAGDSYHILPPHVSLSELNKDICEQNLSSCQFCTAVYCVLDAHDLTLTYARAGHPDPVLIHADGRIEVLSSQGSLLGVFPEEEYESRKVQLNPGDRLLVYTDGAEDVLCESSNKRQAIDEALAPWVGMSRERFLLQLTARSDAKPHTSRFDDDITVMVVDVEK